MNILIDNDKMIQLAWKLAANKKSLDLITYGRFEELLNNLPADKNCNIFIDSDLGNGDKGEILSKKLKDLGFDNIYLTTSFDDINLKDYPWIKAVISKKAPF